MNYHNGDILIGRNFACKETNMNATRRKAAPTELPAIATTREIVNGSSHGDYVPTWQPLRPGADDALKIPSRTGKRLTYRDGRKEVLDADL